MNSPTLRPLPNRDAILLTFLGVAMLSAEASRAEPPAQAPSQQPAQQPAPSEAQNPPPRPTVTWETRHAGDLTFEAPFPIEDGPDVLSGAPEKVRDTLVSVKTYKAGSPKQGYQISVTTIIYKPGVAMDMDGAIKAVTTKITAFAGDTVHKFTIEPTKVSGLDARHSEFHGTARNGRPFYASLAVVQQGQKLWQVQALCMNEALVPEVERVMGSIAIEPAP